MKIRNGYVSNSSSSSFLIAYDERFFGDIYQLFKKYYMGETSVHKEDDLERFYSIYCDNDEEREKYQKMIEIKKQEGQSICYLNLDYEFVSLIGFMRQINEMNGGNKLEFIYDGGDE